MDTNETIFDPQMNADNHAPEANDKKQGVAGKVAFGVGGAALGVGATMAGQAMAADTDKEGVSEEVNPEDSIIATETGIRVAHVDQADSFAEAFAEARSQVGSGGVFEWHGRVYGTYLKDEWANMTEEQRADFQSSIDYDSVLSENGATQEHYATADQPNVQPTVEHHENHHHEEPSQVVEVTDEVAVDPEVRILSVEMTDLNRDGVPENAVLMDVDGNEVLVLDINLDSVADLAICDVNRNGQLDCGEILDISDDGLVIPAAVPPGVIQSEQTTDYMADNTTEFYDI